MYLNFDALALLNTCNGLLKGFISGFALIAPWALQECRAYGTHKAERFSCSKF